METSPPIKWKYTQIHEAGSYGHDLNLFSVQTPVSPQEKHQIQEGCHKKHSPEYIPVNPPLVSSKGQLLNRHESTDLPQWSNWGYGTSGLRANTEFSLQY